MAKNASTLSSDHSDSVCDKRIQNSVYFDHVSKKEVEGIISTFNSNKAQSIDNIPDKLIYLAKASLTP